MRKVLHLIHLYLRLKIGAMPVFSILFSLRNRELIVGRGTDIVIEGFPRTGNTFAVVAFKNVQDRNYQIAHHLHIISQVKKAVSNNVPVIVLVRNPVDTWKW